MMNKCWSQNKTRLLAVSVLLVSGYFTAVPSVNAETLEELKASMAEMQQVMERMEQRIAVMEAEKAVEKKAAANPVQVPAQKTTGLQLSENTTLSIYGYTKLDVIYTDTGGGGKYNYSPKLVPLDSERDALANNAFTMSARESRFGLGTSTDTDYGQLNTKIEIDFYGTEGNERTSNSHGLRLRLAYAELGKFRVGQDWSTFVDASAYPEYVDFGFSAGRLFVLQPLVRWTQPFEGGSFQFAFENPESFFLTETTGTDGVSSNTTVSGNGSDEYIPDIIARLNLQPGYGRYSVAGMVRCLSYDNGLSSDTAWTAALSANAVLPVFEKDSINLALNYGTGLGRYMRADFDDAFVDPLSNTIETNVQIGFFAGYRHFWLDSLRSSLIYSYAGRDNDLSYVTDAADKAYQSVHANIFWSPVPKVDIGLEYIWGYREVENGEDGDMNRVQGGFKYKF